MEGYTTNNTAGEWNPAEVKMSFFRRPITNKRPEAVPVTLFQVYQYVRGRWAMTETEHLRSIADKDEARQYKGANFDYVTPSGIFSYCSDQCLMKHSGVLSLAGEACTVYGAFGNTCCKSTKKNGKKYSLCEKTAKNTRYSEKNVYLCGVNLRIE